MDDAMRRLRQHARARPLLAYLVTVVLLEGGVLLTRPGRNVTPFLLVLVPRSRRS
jgi:hypothetical protein